jgi:hypothetical protein
MKIELTWRIIFVKGETVEERGEYRECKATSACALDCIDVIPEGLHMQIIDFLYNNTFVGAR